MACSTDYLKKVASEGFSLIDKNFARQAGKAYRPAPPPGVMSSEDAAKMYGGFLMMRDHESCGRPHDTKTTRRDPPPLAISSEDAAAMYRGILIADPQNFRMHMKVANHLKITGESVSPISPA